jgi:hypothetical protein
VKDMYPTKRHDTCIETSIRSSDGVVRPYWFCSDNCNTCEICGNKCAEMSDHLCCGCQRVCPVCGGQAWIGSHGMSEYGGCV